MPPPLWGLGIRLRQCNSLPGKFQSASRGIAGLSVWVVESVFLKGIRFIIPTARSAVPFGFRVDHEVLEAVVKESGPSLMHPHPPGAVYTLLELASDRCRLIPLIGAVSVCLERGAELGDGIELTFIFMSYSHALCIWGT